MKKNVLIAAAIIVSVAAAAWFQWLGGGLGSQEDIQQQLLGEWYLYEQGDFGPLHATEHLEIFSFLDTANRVKPAGGTDDLIRDANVTAYIDKAPSFMNTATLVSRISAVNLRQIHTIGTTYEVYGDRVAINMGRQGARLLQIRELGPERMVWTENDKAHILVRKSVYDNAPKEELARIFNVAVLEAAIEK